MPLLGNSERTIRGQKFYPYFVLKGTAWFFFIFGAVAALATFAQINPVWLYGPYNPLAISSASQPDWYLGILEGALRAMPAWEVNILGHTPAQRPRPRRDRTMLEHGVETGIIWQQPDGGFTEEVRPVSDEERAVLAAKPAPRSLPLADANGIPAPARTGPRGKLRALVNAAFTETVAAAATNGRAADPSHDRAGGEGEQLGPASAAGKAAQS